MNKRIKVLTAELPLLSEKWRVGGTLDMVATINNGPIVLIDFKTSSAIRPAYVAQVAAYVDMLEEHYGKVAESALIVRFGKDGHCDELEVFGDLLDFGRDLFQHALWLHRSESQIASMLRSGIRRAHSLQQSTYTETGGSRIVY
jgi:hypothetical protein